MLIILQFISRKVNITNKARPNDQARWSLFMKKVFYEYIVITRP